MAKAVKTSEGFVHISKRRYTRNALRMVLAEIFVKKEAFSRRAFENRLRRVLSNSRNWSLNCIDCVAKELFLKKFLVDVEGEISLSEGGQKEIYCFHNYEVKKDLSTLKESGENFEPVRQKNKRPARVKKTEQNQIMIGILRIIFMNNAYESFGPDEFQKILYDILCSEWHGIKYCTGVTNARPTHKSVAILIRKMERFGIVERLTEYRAVKLYLTEHGKKCCFGEENVPERTDKRTKVSRVLATFPEGEGVPCSGLRKLKKRARRISQADCSA